MKMIQDKHPLKLKPFEYDQAVLHILEIFPSCSHNFDENCIESFGHIVQNKKIAESYVWYNKIAVDFEGKKIYWPIQPYKLINPQGREASHFDTFKTY